MSDPVSIHEAKTHLSRLIARAEAGEEVVIRRGQTPVAKLTAYEPPLEPRKLGGLEDEIWIADDFDEPLEEFREYMP